MPSSVIKKMQYDHEKEILRIVFMSGKTYDYLDVPEHIFATMMSAQSLGIFFNQQIKPNYPFRKIKEK